MNKLPRVFLIAEAGSNWRVSSDDRTNLQTAYRLIDAAAFAGADAVKFQTFRADKVYVLNAGESSYLSKSGIKTSIVELFKKLEMPYEFIPLLAARCKRKKIEFMSSVFSADDFKVIDPWVKRHKIASYEITHPGLIRLTARSKKPTLISTGACDLEDVRWALAHYRKCGGIKPTIMQCTASYPAPLESLNIKAIEQLRSRYSVPVGFSDHSKEVSLGAVMAVALGAACVEKHFTLDRSLPGPDHKFAINAEELRALAAAVRQAEAALGDGQKRVLPVERELFDYAKRGIQATREIRRGEKIVAGMNVDILRPGKQRRGDHPKYLNRISNKTARRTIRAGQGIRRADHV